MKIALLDLGSNTIKMAVYEKTEHDFTKLSYEAIYAYVIGFVHEEQLTQEGIQTIISALLQLKEQAQKWDCAVLDCFSTASLRYIKNRERVCREVFEATGIEIHALSGDEEAYYNFVSMKLIAGEPNFVGGDLGGGSMQLFCCKNDELVSQQSFPLGGMKLFGDFVTGTLPTKEEAKKIRAHVRKLLETSKIYDNFTAKTLYFMGGTTRMIGNLLHAENGAFQATELEEQLLDFLTHPDRAEEIIMQTLPERLHSILPGMLVLAELCRIKGIGQLQYTENSVREGYLWKNY